MPNFIDAPAPTDQPSPPSSTGPVFNDKPAPVFNDAPAPPSTPAPLPQPNQNAPTTTQFAPNSAIRVTPHAQAQEPTKRAARAQGNPVQHAVESGIAAATGALHAAEASGMHALNDTLGALDAALGAPGRAVQGAIAGDNTSPVDRVRAALDNAMHPFDRVKVGHNLDETMRRLGVTKIDQVLEGAVPKDLPFGTTKKARDAVHFLSVIGAQTITDPLSATPFVKKIKKAAHAAHMASEIGAGIDEIAKGSSVIAPTVRAAQATGQGLMKAGAHYFGRRPELDDHLDAIGKAGRLSIENKIHTNISNPSATADAALLDKLAPQLRAKANGQYTRPVPEELRQRMLQEAYVYGTPTMRQEAINQGYEALTIKHKGQAFLDAQKKHNGGNPYGVLDYNVAKDYNTMVRAKNIKDSSMFDEFGAKGGNAYTKEKSKNKAAWEKSATGRQQLGDQDPVEVWRQRLNSSRAWTTRRLVDRETEKFLANHGGIKGFDWDKATQVDRDAAAGQAVNKLSYDPVRYELGAFGTVADKMRGASRMSIMLNPLPHGLRNVGELAYLAGGPRTFGAGLAHAATGIADADAKRLENLGLHADYIRDMQGPLAKGPVGAAFKADARLMNRLEGGFRNALLHHYDRALGPSKSIADEYRKADLVQRDLGDYRNASRFVAALEAIGGPFVAFRIGTVPSAVGRAVRARPALPESIARAENDQTLPDPRLSDANSRFHVGGPVTDAADLAFDTKGYLEKPATAGVLGQAMQQRDRLKEGFGESPGEMAEQAATSYIPGASLLGAAANVGADAMHKQLPWAPFGDTGLPQGSALRLLLENLMGFYNSKKPSGKSAHRRDKMLSKTIGGN